MAKLDPQVLAHLEWLGFVQPVGLVVSAPALVRAGAVLDRRDAEGQRLLRECLAETPDGDDSEPLIRDFVEFATRVLGWSFSAKGYAGTDDEPIPPELEVVLADYGEILRPDFAVRERDPAEGASPWQLLVTTLDGIEFDTVTRAGGQLEASAHGRMERLLRETGVSAGLLFNGRALRLISAPRGESSGWLEFDVAAMVQTAGRPISTAMRLLLREPRLLTLPRKQRLSALLADSRRFQNEVSEKLAEQVLHALYELLRGFQAAHDASDGELLRTPLGEEPDEVYRALLTVILRLVFVLFAEERDMLPTEDATFSRYYSIAGLHERLRDHAAHFPDTMDQRYGAWAQLLVLFRMVHDGATAGDVKLPARRGVLFDPDRFPFLEGRTGLASRQIHERIEPPLVPDGTVYRALDKLLMLDGERISYRALDVEQIGSVYETMMGFRLETATGRSLAIKAAKRMGAPTAIDLDALLAEDASKRAKWIQDLADRKLPPKVAAAVKNAASVEELHGALVPVVDTAATPDLLSRGAMVLQPSEERRRSGSHYTPRTLTEPIVRTTLEPVLAALRGDSDRSPSPEAILELKVCDPAMGSGAFLVETCRQLGDALIEAWSMHGGRPEIPLDEDEVVFARRLIAQRCLYGVDRNPVAVDLAKMSLWLATLAREHALTFVDHALRHGDSLVGLSRRQIQAFHWDDTAPPLAPVRITQHLERVSELRAAIRNAGDDVSDWALRDMWDEAQTELAEVRLFGDLVVLAYFSGVKATEREAKRLEFATGIADGSNARYRALLEERREADQPLVPFHWGVEFPEVFSRPLPGFDVVVGNPPFAGKNTLASANPPSYLDWLKLIHEDTHGNADLVAHFFRRMFNRLRPAGTLGLIATNTIGQGDTRSTGLRWICVHGGQIYAARRRVRWPGKAAAVVVSVVHIAKSPFYGAKHLDGREVDSITAFLFHRGGDDDPVQLVANDGRSFQGSIVLGMGFTFDDADTKGIATPLFEMERLAALRPENAEVVRPYLGYSEVATDPKHANHRWVIDFGDRSEAECRSRWPELMAIVEARVRPERAKLTKNAIGRKRATYWWQYGSPAKELYAAIEGLPRVLVAGSQASTQYALAFLPEGLVYSSNLTVLAVDSDAGFATLQSRVHEIWARFFMSTLKDDLAYTPTTVFEPFPFSPEWETSGALTAAGKAYHEFRRQLMISNDEGLTKTYNRFHDPDERSPEISTLRELHTAMDRAVLDDYGWTDVPTDCDFVLDYEDEDGEAPGRRKKPWRNRWPDDVHDEVLARLIELNAERAAVELRSGAIAEPKTSRVSAGKPTVAVQPDGLF
jgi:hypothetical protein